MKAELDTVEQQGADDFEEVNKNFKDGVSMISNRILCIVVENKKATVRVNNIEKVSVDGIKIRFATTSSADAQNVD